MINKILKVIISAIKYIAALAIGFALGVALIAQYDYRAENDMLLITTGTGYGRSMLPTLPEEAHTFVMIQPISLERGDIVSIKLDEKDEYYCKRIIGLPGEKIKISTDAIYINGELYEEVDYEHIPMDSDMLDYTYQLDDDEYFVMGDNRPESYDSRYFGPIKRSEIKYEHLMELSPLVD